VVVFSQRWPRLAAYKNCEARKYESPDSQSGLRSKA
jgi:hypothetical protein